MICILFNKKFEPGSVSPAILREGVYTFFFYVKETAEARTYFEFERGASRVRSAFAKRIEFFEAKHVGTFNANRSRQPRRSRH